MKARYFRFAAVMSTAYVLVTLFAYAVTRMAAEVSPFPPSLTAAVVLGLCFGTANVGSTLYARALTVHHHSFGDGSGGES